MKSKPVLMINRRRNSKYSQAQREAYAKQIDNMGMVCHRENCDENTPEIE